MRSSNLDEIKSQLIRQPIDDLLFSGNASKKRKRNGECASQASVSTKKTKTMNGEVKKRLEDLGFNSYQISTMASYMGDFFRIEDVIEKYNELQDRGFTNEEIVSIVAHGAGSWNLDYVIKYYDRLIDKGFKHSEIVKIAACNTGFRNLDAVLRYYDDLIAKGFNHEQIFEIFSYDGGDITCDFINENHFILTEMFYYDNDKLIHFFSCDNGYINIKRECIQVLEIYLLNRGCSQAQVDRILNRGDVFSRLNSMLSSREKLTENGFNASQILTMAIYIGDFFRIEDVIEKYNELKDRDFTNEEIVSIAAHSAGSWNLNYVIEYYDGLIGKGFKHSEIVKIASCNTGFRNLDAALRYYDDLIGKGFNHEQILEIFSYDGGDISSGLIVENFDSLTNKFSHQEIVVVSACNRGYIDLKKYFESANKNHIHEKYDNKASENQERLQEKLGKSKPCDLMQTNSSFSGKNSQIVFQSMLFTTLPCKLSFDAAFDELLNVSAKI